VSSRKQQDFSGHPAVKGQLQEGRALHTQMHQFSGSPASAARMAWLDLATGAAR
jgi:hypothetical protein